MKKQIIAEHLNVAVKPQALKEVASPSEVKERLRTKLQHYGIDVTDAQMEVISKLGYHIPVFQMYTGTIIGLKNKPVINGLTDEHHTKFLGSDEHGYHYNRFIAGSYTVEIDGVKSIILIKE